MNKYLKGFIIGFSAFFVFSLVVYSVSNIKNNIETKNNVNTDVDSGVLVDVDNIIETGNWEEISEEDKITLAMGTETDIISKVKKYLADNKIAVFFVYGGPFDQDMLGNYIVCTGFNENGKAKILYPNDNFTSEWKYSFEGLIECSYKVMLFDM